MKNNKKSAPVPFKNQPDQTENLVADTSGGEIPDANRNQDNSASDAAEIFGNFKPQKTSKTRDQRVRDQMVVDSDEGRNENEGNIRDTELDAEDQAS